MQKHSVFISDFTKDFVVVVEAFVGVVTVDFVSGDVRNSFLYCGSELDVKYVGLAGLVVACRVVLGKIIS
jgi:hypothetical protein